MLQQSGQSLACDLNAIAPEERAHHIETAAQVFGSALETRELPDGYAWRLPAESAVLRAASAYIANERLCCPFFRFTLELEPHSAALWLRLTGEDGVKEVLRAEFADALNKLLKTSG
jgi:hypothetical protein